MKPPAFDVQVARDTAEAVEFLADGDGETKVLAGGQSLVPLLSFRLARPDRLVDVNAAAELASLECESGTLRVGSMVRQRTIERSDLVARTCPLLTEILPYVAHAPIRNRGTFGGSLAHADPGAELCAASVVLEARLRVTSVRGEREIAAADFYVGPFSTTLADDELLTEILIPPLPPGAGWAFAEVARRQGDFAIVGTAAVLAVDAAGTITDARLGYLSMDSTCRRASTAEAALTGEVAAPDLFAHAGEIAADELSPSSDLHASADYRRHLAAVLTRRTLAASHARAGGDG
jgi:aerobic carbon-monoxide dehydrogenase medium subunit